MGTSAFRSFVSRVSRLRAVAVATTAALLLGLTPAGTQAQPPSHAKKPEPEPYVYTVDVAEDMDLFVPTFVRPEDTQPERGSFYVTRGRVFPEGTIQGDGATFDPNTSGHIGVWISRGTHLASASELPDAPWWATTTQLFVLRPAGEGAAHHGRHRGSGDDQARRDRWRGELRRVDRRGASDVARVQCLWRREPPGDVRPAAPGAVGRREP